MAEPVVLGAIGVPGVVRVDPAGTLHLEDGSSLELWIGAEDRWHLAPAEVAVRQQDGPGGTETRMRVPGGDIVQRTWVVPHWGRGVAVVEVVNETPVPVAAALVATGALRWRAARPPAADGLAPLPRALTPTESAGVWPVPHQTALRLVVELAGDGEALPDPAAVPGPADVARGWERHLTGTARVELPDAELAGAVATARRTLLVAGQGWLAARALYAWGHGHEADEVAEAALAAGASLDGPGLVAVDELVRRAPDGRELAAVLVEPVAAAVHAVVRGAPSASRRDALLAAARLLAWAGDARASADVAAAAGALVAVPLPEPAALLHTDAATLLLAVRDLLVDDRGEAVDLLPGLPDAWLGLGVELHDLPTRHGPVAAAVRWHGPRPAILWDAPVPVRASRLDPAWAGAGGRGEALLAEATVDVTPGPAAAPVQRGLTIEAAEDPGSFA